MPKISVIIPIYNTGEILLKRCIDSILSQTFSDFELILVDDCSTGNCPEICEDYAKNDSRIKVIHNQENKGCPQSRKIGFEQSQGDYILLADSDDWLESTMLAELYNCAVENQADLTYCDFFMHQNSEKQIVQQGDFLDTITAIKSITSKRTYGFIWNKLIRRALFDKIIFPVDFWHEDEVIVFQLLYFANRIEYVPKALYQYYCHWTDQMDNVEIIGGYNNYKIIVDFLREKYSENIQLFEPELSDIINLYKMGFVLNKPIRNRQKLFELYPESNKNIFRSSRSNDKIKFYCMVHRLPYSVVILFVNIFRMFKRKITQKNHAKKNK
jgi:glycosyltransferase involved in cell wall biosynthesis